MKKEKMPSRNMIEIIQRRYPHCPKQLRLALLKKLSPNLLHTSKRNNKFSLYPSYVLSPHTRSESFKEIPVSMNPYSSNSISKRNKVNVTIPTIYLKTSILKKNQSLAKFDRKENSGKKSLKKSNVVISNLITSCKYDKKLIPENIESKLPEVLEKKNIVENMKKRSIAIGTDSKRTKWSPYIV